MHTPSKYQPPFYVQAFVLTALLCAVIGIVMLAVALKNSEFPFFAMGAFIAAGTNWLYSEIANDVARNAWQSARTAHLLEPALRELAAQAAERSKREVRADQEVRRAMEERLSAARASAVDDEDN